MNPGLESRGLQMGSLICGPRFSQSHMSGLSSSEGIVNLETELNSVLK
jgi:hypothetical protein